MKNIIHVFILIIICCPFYRLIGQDKYYYQTDFSLDNLEERRIKIMNIIGSNAFALVQGSSGDTGFSVFRQSNTFYYLTGLETDHAYLLIDGKDRKTTLYLPHRDEGREKGQGKVLSAEDDKVVKALTGADMVKGLEFLASDLLRKGLIKAAPLLLYTPLSPSETGNDSRDEILYAQARSVSDPWDESATKESLFIQKINTRFPQFEIRDLSPILDSMRIIKSKEEIALIRKATQIAGLGIIEAMRSTDPGIFEYQLDAAAKYVFHLNGARGDGYASIIGGGTNAYMGHYFHKRDMLNSGDLVLMDYAPDYRYYTSDVTRIWPVNGKFDSEQKALYNYILAYRDALFKYIKPGVTSDEILDRAAADMKQYLIGKTFSRSTHLEAVQKGIEFRGHFQHPVGMAVHDVGNVRGVPLKPGMVFTIDPMIWIPEERLYIRIEDVALVTADGVENLSAFVPSAIEDVENTMKEKGLIEFHPPTPLPFED